jgi:dihydroorotase
MRLLIRSAKVIDKQSPYHGLKKDFLIENGIITHISDHIPETSGTIIDYPDMNISPGWFDLRVSAQDPGYEAQEDLISVRKAAAAGGFTGIAVLPNTHPTVQTKESIFYQKTKGSNSPVEVYPIAAVTIDTKGIDLTEMIDLHHAGAIAFSDGHHPLQNSDMVLKVLQYLQPFQGLFINRPEDTLLTRFGVMNEGLSATKLGMKGMPKMAESMMIMRDLKILEYTGGKIHFSCISTAESIELIRQAKKQGLQVTCDIAAYQIAFDDEALADFDTNFKVNPPFRNQADIEALWKGLADGTIDVIVSDHHPLDEESKQVEFDVASFGITGLETLFGILNFYNKDLNLADLLEKIIVNPRRILNLAVPKLAENEPANLTLFETEKEWILNKEHIFSKSSNTPFIGKPLKGKVLGVVNNNLTEIFTV